ncbi:MAG: hypothetical protein NZT61_04130 [Deltaproteobacteria bacterium]|nr:hypothetical protein [Deltaproteobacteria bacterium]MCX7952773.1 hypothetical protein [Deltaproteobacteria bacterium]
MLNQFTFLLLIFATISVPQQTYSYSVYVLEGSREVLCKNCRTGLIPASIVKLVPFLKLYENFRGKVFQAKICLESQKFTLILPLDPSMSSGDLLSLLKIFKPSSKVKVLMPQLRLSPERKRKLNLGIEKPFYPLDFLVSYNLLTADTLIVQKETLGNPDHVLDKICRDLSIVCDFQSVEGNLSEANQPLRANGTIGTVADKNNCVDYPVTTFDKTLRAIGSYSNNFATEISLAFFSEKMSVDEGEKKLKEIVSREFPHSDIKEFTGLDRANRIACYDIVRFVKAHVERDPSSLGFLSVQKDYPVYRHIGDINQTIFAKTGSLDGVSSLVGVYPIKTRDTLSFRYFCIIQNCSDCLFDLKSRERELLQKILSK